MYKAIEYFTDLKDNDYPYKAGDEYPRAGYSPEADRIAELASNKNRRGRAVIEKVAETAAAEIAAEEEKTGENEVFAVEANNETADNKKPVKTAKKTKKTSKQSE